jgi:hypothetical protein
VVVPGERGVARATRVWLNEAARPCAASCAARPARHDVPQRRVSPLRGRNSDHRDAVQAFAFIVVRVSAAAPDSSACSCARAADLRLTFTAYRASTPGSRRMDASISSRSAALYSSRARRYSSGGYVFDVQIVRDASGRYWLTVRDAVRVPLA